VTGVQTCALPILVIQETVGNIGDIVAVKILSAGPNSLAGE